jgi:hypothetical protein
MPLTAAMRSRSDLAKILDIHLKFFAAAFSLCSLALLPLKLQVTLPRFNL